MMKVRSIGAISITTNSPLAVSVRADQNPDILKMVGAGPVTAQKQNLIIGVNIADLTLGCCHAGSLSGQFASEGFVH